MQKQLQSVALFSVAAMLTACGSVAIMSKSDLIKQQPEMIIKTDGDFWGLGQDGTFDLTGLYKGQYSRHASNSSWFDTISTSKGEMAANITNTQNNQMWTMSCSGGGTSVNYMGVQFGGNKPYQCTIFQAGEQVGQFVMQEKSAVIDLSLEKKETGYIEVGDTRFELETVHTSEGLLMPLESPLGYSFKHNGREIAAVQTNGMLTVQWLPELTSHEQDVLAIGAIAGALSWRPKE
ncbi:hypothetical protein OC513_14310 [Vibrio vulnificus]|nr:hypothetical protein [Vibrio vulnificus]MCU8468854.1 hypothetical protein [Vibrio vulnificus]